MSMIGNLLSISTQQLEDFIQSPNLLEAYVYGDQKDQKSQTLDLDKTWHAIHFILNGDAYGGQGPLAMVFFGGKEIGEDLGIGPARYLTAEQVKQVANSVEQVSDHQFSKQYDIEALDQADIYPNMWDEDSEEGLQYILPYFQDLKQFYQEAALRNQAVLIYIQ
ncbi:YfbM family protein [Acinetobacter bereziniae]|uniref:YfbM family protein n=1 Tax=Acinetobacter bereziniae TaxID=106648 RepID=UPI00125FE55F|nr:YfbM family protein [Acinetobacter bereziniae]